MKHFLPIIFLSSICLYSRAEDIRVKVSTEPLREFTVSPLLFGSFSEMHGGDIVPGIYEEYIINPSFEEWYRGAVNSKTDLVWRDAKEFDGTAYPWESKALSGAPVFSFSEDCANTAKSQKITVKEGDVAALTQRLALPDYRIGRYNLSFYAKVSGDIRLDIYFYNKEGKKSAVSRIRDLGNEWKKIELKSISLDKTEVRTNGRYGIYNLRFEASGEGSLSLDQVLLFPCDCIEGVFNPETVAYFKEYKVACIRWPGGNFTSGYHWKSGVGPTDKRMTEPNLAWNGVNSNLMGTDEFLRFCELVGTEPVMGVGYGLIPPEEAAEWVEYCNGGADTKMGALRAANGHPEPYGVKYWGVGNEVYGDYQIGHTDAVSYGKGLEKTISLMKKADPSITVIASSYGVHNSYRKPQDWNRTVYENASGQMDMFDSHLYVHGPGAKRTKKYTEEEIFRIFAAAPLYFRSYLDAYRADTHSTPLSVLEWGVLPSAKDIHTPDRQKFTNLILSAGIYNEMIRNCDIIKMAAAHNFSYYVAPQRSHSEPVNPRTVLFREYGQLSGSHLLRTDYSAVPTYEVSGKFNDIGNWKDVPEMDIVATRRDNHIFVSVVNNNTSGAYSLSVELDKAKVLSVSGHTFTSDHPFVKVKWSTAENCLNERPASVQKKRNILKVQIPELSLTILDIKVK